MSDSPFNDYAANEPDPMANAFAEAGIVEDGVEQVNAPPVYKMMPESRLPVSSRRGPLWKSRKDVGERSMSTAVDAWEEAIQYYNQDQSDHRNSTNPNMSGNRRFARRLNDQHTATENIVYSNVSAQVPELYAKNPDVAMTGQQATDPAQRSMNNAFARAGERLVTTLFSMKTTPGVDLKPKARKNVLLCLLTNRAWFETGYVQREQSSDQALEDLQAASDKLKNAKTDKEIREAEAEITAIEEKIEFLQPAGPFVRIRMYNQVIVDPDADNGTQGANWVMIKDVLPTEYINAVFGQKDDESQTVRSIYEPSHILTGANDDPNDMNNFTLFAKEAPHTKYGFGDEATYKKAQRTCVWYVWDKVTRRVEMYADNDWKWPIWVWDDPYQLQGFFPVDLLQFHDNPVSQFAKGEVSYYLDQQDQINEINDERSRALWWAKRNLFFDPRFVDQKQADAVLKGPQGQATPLRVPEGMKKEDIIFTLVPPSMNFANLFDKQDLYRAIDRIAATSEAERGGEFKTNTTNKAIDYYSTMGNLRMDARLDAIEDVIGAVGWKILQLCSRFMPAETVRQITGLDVTGIWDKIDPLVDLSKWSMVVVGGSTQKLSSQAKKRDALEAGQVLSQFVRAAPATTLKVILQTFAEAFDGMTISQEDISGIAAEVERTLVAGQGGAPGVGSSGGGTDGARPPDGSGGAPGGGDPMQVAGMVVQGLERLPPNILRAIGIALAEGAQPRQILEQMMSSANVQATGGTA